MIEVPESYKLRLRNQLHWILNVERCSLEQQPEKIKQLAEAHPHSITLVEQIDRPPPGSHAKSCHAFTFDLLHTERLSTPSGDTVIPSDEFVERMICDHLSEVATPTEGGVVVYFESESVTHSGRCRPERIHSKWGSGHIWSHELFETPSSYGCIARFYVALEPDVHQSAWRTFAKQFTRSAGSGIA